MDRELIARNIVNILDVQHCREWGRFANDDLFDQLEDCLKRLTDESASADIDILMSKNKELINKIAFNHAIVCEERNQLMEDLMAFKRKHIMKRT